MKNRMMAIVVGSTALALYAGCVGPAEPGATPDPATVDTEADTAEAGLILRLELEAGHSVSFYEPSPGGLFLAERRSGGQKFVLGDKEVSDALAAFVRLRPGAAIPVELQAAYDRARNLPSDAASAPGGLLSDSEPEVSAPQAATPGVVQQSLTSSSAASNFVNVDGGCGWGPTRSACRVNWGGNFFASWNPATSGLCIVDHYAGNGVTVQITVGGAISASFQAVNTSVQYGLGVPGAATTRRIDVLNAGGDSLHAGCRWGV